MKKKKITYFAIPFMLAGTIGFTMTGCTSNQSIEKSSSYAGGKLPVKAMKAKNVDEIHIWQKAMPIFTTTDTILTPQMKFCLLVFIPR